MLPDADGHPRPALGTTAGHDDVPRSLAGPARARVGAVAHWTGHPATFLLAFLTIVVWAVTGPIFAFSNTWQLIINTSTTIITFLMVFLIQNTQNRDSQAVQLKLDELIRVTRGAHNALLDLEELEDEELALIRQRYGALAARARVGLKAGEVDTDTPEVAP